MPVLAFATTAGEFLDEELSYIEDDPAMQWVLDGWFEYNPHSRYPYEWWFLQ